MEGKVKYIFGLIKNKNKTDGPVQLPESVEAIPVGGISALVTDSPRLDPPSMRKEAVAGYLIRHQQVLEKVMESHSVIPARLGACAGSRAEVAGALKFGYRDFIKAFAVMEGKVEIDIAASWPDMAPVVAETAEADAAVREFKERLASKPGGATTEDRIKAGRMISRALEEKNRKTASEIMSFLAPATFSLRTHGLMNDSMILNAALLVRNNQREKFFEMVNRLDEAYHGRINFRCVGPLPVYSFCTAEIKKIERAEIDRAMGLLGLPENKKFTASGAEIKRAYRQRARLCHPDLAGFSRPAAAVASRAEEKESCAIKFDKITGAYRLLMECSSAHACRGDDGSVLIATVWR